jgi:hypothetical protein
MRGTKNTTSIVAFLNRLRVPLTLCVDERPPDAAIVGPFVAIVSLAPKQKIKLEPKKGCAPCTS